MKLSSLFSFRSSDSGDLLAQTRCCSCLGCLEHFEDPENHCLLKADSLAGPILRHEMPAKPGLTNSQLHKEAVPGFDHESLEDFWTSLSAGDLVGFRVDESEPETSAPRFCIAMLTSSAWQLERQERHGSNTFYRGWFVVKARHLEWEKSMLNGDNVYKIQRPEDVLNCATLLEVPPLRMPAMALGRYTLPADELTFVVRYASLGPVPKRKRGKPVSAPIAALATFELWPHAHNDICEICDKRGTLVCCAYCNLVFHKRCLDSVSRDRLKVLQQWPCQQCAAEMDA